MAAMGMREITAATRNCTNCPALGTARGALQYVVRNIDGENYLVTFDAISHVRIHETNP
jgi:hypothetical protein